MSVNTINDWYGRFGNNVQQICNGLLFSEIHGSGFISPDHEFINPIYFNATKDSPITGVNQFFYYSGEFKTFDINQNYLYKNIRRVANTYILPQFKFEIEEPFDEDTLVIHLRSGDIFGEPDYVPHPEYYPNPLCYFLNLIEEFPKVLIVKEPDNYHPVINELKKIDKVQFQSKTVLEDFATLLRAKNLASSGTGTFPLAAALCSGNIRNFYCSDIYLTGHLNPEMLMETDVTVNMMELPNYIQEDKWTKSEEQVSRILTYKIEE